MNRQHDLHEARRLIRRRTSRPAALLAAAGLRVALAGFALTCLAVDPAAADTRGFSFGLNFQGGGLSSVRDVTDGIPNSVSVEKGGGGGSLWAGWGFNDRFSLRLSLAGLGHETSEDDVTVGFGSATIEGIVLMSRGHFRPFVAGGVGIFAVGSSTEEFDFATAGPGIVAGTGFYYFLGDTFAIEVSGRGEFVNWEETRTFYNDGRQEPEVETPIEREGTAGKFGLGVSWWF